MIILKILGGIDLIAAFTFLMLVFGIQPYLQIIMFCSGLLLLKGLFVFTGEPLSAIDLVSSIILIFSIFFSLPAVILWVPAFLLIAKGFVSFF